MIYGIKRLNHDEKNLPASFFQPKLLDRGKLRRKLEELNYSPRETEIILDLLREDPDGEITKWIESGEISEKVKEKMKKTGLDFPAAYIEAKEGVERHFSTTGSKVWIMFGIPGSGKSTWIKNNKPNLPVVSRDLIREKLGIQGKYKGSPMFEYEVTLEHRKQTDKLLKDGKEFIIDDTNLGSYTSSLFRYLRLNGASEIVGVIIKTPLEVCIKRRPEIPEEVLKTMNGYIKTFPWSKELDKILWIKQI